MSTFVERRREMVRNQVELRGVRDPGVLVAMRNVPREAFVPAESSELAYEDSPLPIQAGQTISQPYIVALMIEAARIKPGHRVLEVGCGSGYAAAVMGRIAGEVHAIEWHRELAELARGRMESLGYANVHVRQGDGSLGLPEKAPFDAIVVSAGGPEVPKPLLEQLAIGGRLVIPVGADPREQELVVVMRTAEHAYDRFSLGEVRFVPLVGSLGWGSEDLAISPHRARAAVEIDPGTRARLASIVSEACEPFDSIEHAPLDRLLERLRNARIVLIGESTHGTAEFYRLRARITEALIARAGFNVVAIEGDWPDVAAVDAGVRRLPPATLREKPFSRFPRWMWDNLEMERFVSWLRRYDEAVPAPAKRASLHGLDIYSLNNSIGAVLGFLDRTDPEAAAEAREHYSCFTPWETDPATYGRGAITGRLAKCEDDAVAVLRKLLHERLEYARSDPEAAFDAERNAAVVRSAERYYRAMYRGSAESWNLRDRHMAETLEAILAKRGPDAKAVVWAHNSHVGRASATSMGARGETNIGQLLRERFGDRVFSIGFGTHAGTVAAASDWDGPMEVKRVRPSHPDSYERVFHETAIPRFFLPLRAPLTSSVRNALLAPRLERAIGVVYRPETELVSHYFEATLPLQFDEYIWIDETTAVEARPTARDMRPTAAAEPELYPFGL
jgi:protein-L-isoaspartate(D-aspartate) O-methyltransferase